MKLEDLLAENIDKWKAMVTELGGQWVGVQQGFQDVEPFVLFVAPSSMSPIGVPVSQMTLDNVKQKMGLKSVSKKTQNVDAARLKTILANLFASACELDNVANDVREYVRQLEEELKNAEK